MSERIDLVDSYDKRLPRISVLVDYLNDQIVYSNAYPEHLVAAVDFLHEEVRKAHEDRRNARNGDAGLSSGS